MNQSMDQQRDQSEVPSEAQVEMPPEIQSVKPQRRQIPRLAFAAVLGLLIGQAGIISTDAGHLGAAARAERVYLDMQSIAGGLREISQAGDLESEGMQRVSWVYGPGDMPQQAPFEQGSAATPLDQLNKVEKGRYIQILMPDPWGNAYLANVDGLRAGAQRIKVLSAGPDGTIDTTPSDTTAQGDDVLIHLF